MKIAVYAGSIQHGGGLTVIQQMLSALTRIEAAQVTVFTGTEKVSAALQSIVANDPCLKEVRFLHKCPTFLRYLASKIAFLRTQHDWLISINHYIPTNARLAVYHVNLLSFMTGPSKAAFGETIRQRDARLACRRADLNLFESKYLLDLARSSAGMVMNPGLLYLGVHEDFFRSAPQPEVDPGELLLVSSLAPHKDNETALRTLVILRERRPAIHWRLSIAGGSSKEQWAPILGQAAEFGIADAVEVLGPIDKKSLSARMARSSCVISPSRVESFCAVAVEAMASFCPAIVTSATAMPESVGDAAAVVSPGDAAAFANEIVALLDQPALREQRLEMGRAHAERFRPKAFRNSILRYLTV